MGSPLSRSLGARGSTSATALSPLPPREQLLREAAAARLELFRGWGETGNAVTTVDHAADPPWPARDAYRVIRTQRGTHVWVTDGLADPANGESMELWLEALHTQWPLLVLSHLSRWVTSGKLTESLLARNLGCVSVEVPTRVVPVRVPERFVTPRDGLGFLVGSSKDPTFTVRGVVLRVRRVVLLTVEQLAVCKQSREERAALANAASSLSSLA